MKLHGATIANLSAARQTEAIHPRSNPSHSSHSPPLILSSPPSPEFSKLANSAPRKRLPVPAPPERPPEPVQAFKDLKIPKKILGGGPYAHGLPSLLIRHGLPSLLIRHGLPSLLIRHGLPSPLIRSPPPLTDGTVTTRDAPSGRGAICHVFEFLFVHIWFCSCPHYQLVTCSLLIYSLVYRLVEYL